MILRLSNNRWVNTDLICMVRRWEPNTGVPVLSVCFAGDGESARITDPGEIAELLCWLDAGKEVVP